MYLLAGASKSLDVCDSLLRGSNEASDALSGSVLRTKSYGDLAMGVTLFIYQNKSPLHVLVLVYKFTTVIPITIIYNLC